MVTLGINGFGRIGRLVYRLAVEQGIPVASVNGTTTATTLAHLLKYDSTYGTWNKDIEVADDGFRIDGKETRLQFERDPTRISWDGVDVVLECTGRFRKRDDAAKHLKGSVKKAIIAAPAEGEDITLVLGVNDQAYDREKHHIISNASCTTNCLAPVAKVLHESFGIQSGLMATIHAYTGDQRLLDGTHKDLRRARAAAQSMVPTSTGAAKAVGKVLPELSGKLNGYAIRVPTTVVSLVDLSVQLDKQPSAEDINTALRDASQNMPSILAVSDAPLVSTDFKGDTHSAIVDAPSTMTIGNTAKVVAWYDNEWAYAQRLIDLAQRVLG